MSDARRGYARDGYVSFGPDPEMRRWAEACAAMLPELLAAPEHERWYRCARSWFAGVNILANGADGGIDGKLPPLGRGGAISFLREGLGVNPIAWDRAQVSVAFPGYPRHGDEDTEASYRYRRNRCAAHVDGLERDAERRRKLSETHSFLLGIPLGDAGLAESPFVVWRGSHEIMRAAFHSAFGGAPPEDWREIDITDAYVAARKACFERCEPVRLAPGCGGSYVVHPLALHGIAPWEGGEEGYRAVAYFRPDLFGGDPQRWLTA